MNSKTLTNVVIGAIAFFFMGYLVYEVLLGSFLADHSTSDMSSMVWWSLIVSQFGLAGLATIGIEWKGASDWMSGAKAAATIGAVFVTAYVFDVYANEGIIDEYALVAIWIGEVIRFFVVGAVIGFFAGRGK